MSQENLTLEENQKKGYNSKVAVYEFVCEGAGVTSRKSPQLAAIKRGIRLHFLRFGLFNKNSEEDIDVKAPSEETENDDELTEDEAVELEDVEVIKLKDVPHLENFYVSRTALNAGYLYIMDDADENLFFEYKVSNLGTFLPVFWKDNKDKNGNYLDIRKASFIRKTYEVLKPDSVVWVAYSPVQWSVEYHKSLLTDPEKRKERMLQVNCSGFTKGQESPHDSGYILPYNKLTATYTPQQNVQAYWLEECLKNIHIDETAEDPNNENTLLEDMFITLHDPIGCAYDICEGIDTEVTRLKAMMVSLQTGKSVEEIFPFLQNDEKVPADTSEKGKQIHYLHRLAQLTYDFVYNNHENTEKYSSDKITSMPANIALDLTIGSYLRPFIEQNGVDKSKLEKLLGVQERKNQRAVINSFRDDLGNLMKSDYYQDVTDFYMNSIADSIEDAKETIAIHTIALGSYPNMYDRHLDLKIAYKPKEDLWYKHINETLYNENPSVFTKTTQLLDYKIDIQDIKVLSLVKKTASTIDKIIKAYANHDTYIGAFVALKQKKLPITGKISYFRDKETRVATIKFKALQDFETQINNQNLRLEINGEKVTLKQYKKHWHLEYKKMTQQSTEALIKDGRLDVNLKGNLPKRFKAEAEKLLKSNAFGGLVVIIEAYVWAQSIKKFSKDTSSGRNREKLLFASVKLGAATFSLIEKTKLYDKHLASKGLTNKILQSKVDDFSRNIAKLKLASSAITVFTASRDSYQNFSVRDNDTAVLYGMAAGLGAVFLAADVSALIGGGAAVFAIGFWPAALLGGALIGCYYLAQKYFKDTQLEAYFKNFPLSDYALPPKPAELPHQYIGRLVTNSTEAVIDPWFETTQSKEYKTYSSFEKAYIAFLDISIPSIVIVEPDLGEYEYTNNRKGFDKNQAITNRFQAFIYSAQKINDPDDLDIKAWFYPYGIKAPLKEGWRFEITTFIYDLPEPKHNPYSNEIIPNCTVSFGLPQQFYWEYMKYPKGEILFTCRIQVDDDQYVPTNFKGTPRYAFGHTQTYNQIDNNSKLLTSIFTAHRYNQRINVRDLKLQNTPEEEALQKPKIITENSIAQLESFRVKH